MRIRWVAAAVLLALGACAAPPGRRVAATVELGSSPAQPAAPAGGEREGGGEGGEADVVRCGDARCDVATEVCCTFGGGHHACAPRRAPATYVDPEMGSRYDAQIAACQMALEVDSELVAVEYCDDSTDCPGDAVCCAGPLWGDSKVADCRPRRADGANSCDFYEVCRGELPCHTEGTACRRDVCKATSALPCGATRCRGDRPLCCTTKAGEAACVRDDATSCRSDEGQYRVACWRPADCPAGTACCAGDGESYCAGSCPHARYACLTVADCPADYAGYPRSGCEPDPEDPPRNLCTFRDR